MGNHLGMPEHYGIGHFLGQTDLVGRIATEAARASLQDGFDRVGLDEVVSMTAVGNSRSRSVMERLGMARDPADDFDHPNVPIGHPIRRHVLYRRPAP